MIRYTAILLFFTLLCAYAFKDWFKALCVLIGMMAVIERPDMPSNMFGITGLNPWNIAMLSILCAFSIAREKRDATQAPMRFIGFLAIAYLIVVMTSTIRMLTDYSGLAGYYEILGQNMPSVKDYVVDDLFNSLKWVIPGFLVYKGTNSDERAKYVLIAIAVALLLFAVQVVKQMPLGNLVDGDALQRRAIRVLGNNIGYHRVDIAAILAAGPIIFLAFSEYARNKLAKCALVGASLLLFVAILLTGGRTGLAACLGVGAVMGVLRWRKIAIIAPFVLVAIVLAIPAVEERIMEGMTEDSYETGTASLGVDTIDDSGRDLYAITSGRVLVWPFVIDKFKEGPILGFGRRAMLREGVTQEIVDIYGKSMVFGHPHNAYLEILIDAGIIGAVPIFVFFLIVLNLSRRLVKRTKMTIESLSAIACLSLVLAQLIASVGAQTFYPRQGVVLMYCAIGLLLAVVARQRECQARKQAAIQRPTKNVYG